MQHNLRRIGAGELGDEREEGVPERERVARMQTAVVKLVDRADVEVAEGIELAHAAEVEEGVTVDDPGDVPEQDPEHEPGERDGQGVPGRRP